MPQSFQRKVFVLFCSLLAGSLSAECAEICFKTDVKVSGSLVKLGDVANVQGDDLQQIHKLQSLELFPAPLAGRPRLVRTIDIRQLLRLHDVDLAKHQFSGSNMVRLSCQPMAVKDEPQVLEVSSERQNIPVPILVARRNLTAGESLREADLEIVESPDTEIPTSVLRTTETAIGQEVTRAIAAGEPIDNRFLKRPVLVQKGQTISVIARAAGVQARTTARAIEAGSHGDQILVQSLDTKEKYSATIIGRQQAEVVVRLQSNTRSSDAPATAAELARRPADPRQEAMQ